jgi:uncharacterized protein
MKFTMICSFMLLSVSALPAQLPSDVAPIVAGERRVLRGASDIELSVYLPHSYRETQRRYPVMFVLDPEWNAEHAASTAHFLAANNRMPDMIVVGVGSTDRNRDFTPTSSSAAPNSGGASAFLDRLEQEVIPAIDEHYRTHAMRVLVGHSLGGMFATWAMIERPQLFRGVIALDPSMWWDNRVVARQTLEKLPSISGLRYVVVERAGPGAWSPDSAALRVAAAGNVFALLANPDGESHLSMPMPGLYKALRTAFADFVPDMRFDEGLSTPAALVAQYEERLSNSYGYPVRPSLSILTEVARRSLNRRNGADAIRTAELAVQYYPDSESARKLLVETRSTAATLPVIPPPPASSKVDAQAARLFTGIWTGQKDVRGGVGMKWTVILDASGATWRGVGIAHGVSNEGGDLRGTMPAVVVRGRELELWTHNCCGGYIVSTLKLQDDGTLLGTDAGRDIPRPPGMTPPKEEIIVRLRRAN